MSYSVNSHKITACPNYIHVLYQRGSPQVTCKKKLTDETLSKLRSVLFLQQKPHNSLFVSYSCM